MKRRNSTIQTHDVGDPPPPEGYEEVTDELAGFLDPNAGWVEFIPRHVKAHDGNIDSEKPSLLIVGEYLSGPVNLKGPDGAPMAVKVHAGQLVGLWYKAGMRPIRGLGAVPVAMRLKGEKDVGQPQPMKIYDVRCKNIADAVPLTIAEDHRQDSAKVKVDFAVFSG